MNATTTSRPARWATAAAYAVPLCVLPSAIWRVTTPGSRIEWYLVFLSIFSMVLAVLTLGLVQPWGRRVPARAAVRLAITGGGLLIAICVYFFLNQAFGLVEQGWSPDGMRDAVVREKPGWDVLRFYTPLVLWGPLVIAVALDYRRRALADGVWWPAPRGTAPGGPGVSGRGRGRSAGSTGATRGCAAPGSARPDGR